MNRIETLAAALAAALLLAPVAAPAQHDQDGHGDHAAEAAPAEHEDVVRLDAAVQEEFGIAIAAAAPGVIIDELELPGEVRPDADRLAHLVPRFGGIVTAVRASVGDRVEPGRVLATIESDGSLATYDLKTLIGGTVIDRHLTLGEAVGREDVVFVVADLDTVWVDVTVYQADLDRVRPGQEATVGTGRGGVEATGRVSYVAPVVDEATRTGTARVVLPNPDGRWRPGMFVSVRVVAGREPAAVVVPAEALQDFEGRTVVFTAGDDGFRPRPVTAGRRGGGLVAIAAGLAAGERYVAAGAFTLKAELGKNAFGDGHGH